MPRRRVAAKREILPDPKFGNITLAKFMNHVMVSGKKAVAESIVYGALDIVQERLKEDPLVAFEAALEKIAPSVEGLVHISEIAWERVEKVEDYLKIGDSLDVKYVGFDPRTKKQKVSRRMLIERPKKEK